MDPGDVLTAGAALAIMLGSPTVTMTDISNFASAAGTVLFNWVHGGTDIALTILTLTVVDNTPTFLKIKGAATMSETRVLEHHVRLEPHVDDYRYNQFYARRHLANCGSRTGITGAGWQWANRS